MDSEIKLTEEELDNIVRHFESDRTQITKQFGNDNEANMYLELLKTFKEQILENQEIRKRLTDRKNYHLLCKSKFDSNSSNAKYHETMWEELNKIEKG